MSCTVCCSLLGAHWENELQISRANVKSSQIFANIRHTHIDINIYTHTQTCIHTHSVATGNVTARTRLRQTGAHTITHTHANTLHGKQKGRPKGKQGKEEVGRGSVAGSGSFTDAGRTLKCCSKLDLCPASCSFPPSSSTSLSHTPFCFPFRSHADKHFYS